MNYTITGGSGHLGRLVVAELLKNVDPQNIKVVTRDATRVKDLANMGIKIVVADYNDIESMRSAFASGERLLLVSSPDFDNTLRVLQHANAINAAKEAEVGFIAYTGLAFAEHSQLQIRHTHLATEHTIETTGIPFAFLRNAFYSHLFIDENLNNAVMSGVLAANAGDGRLNTVSREDLAKAAAFVMLDETISNASYDLTAEKTFDFSDLAAMISNVSGKLISYRSVSPEECKKLLIEYGHEAWWADILLSVYSETESGEHSRVSDDLKNIIGNITPPEELVARYVGKVD